MSNWNACERVVLGLRMPRGAVSVLSLMGGQIVAFVILPRQSPHDALATIDRLAQHWLAAPGADLKLSYRLRRRRDQQTLSLYLDGESQVGELIRLSVWLTERRSCGEQLKSVINRLRHS